MCWCRTVPYQSSKLTMHTQYEVQYSTVITTPQPPFVRGSNTTCPAREGACLTLRAWHVALKGRR